MHDVPPCVAFPHALCVLTRAAVQAVAQIMAEDGEVLPWEEGAPQREAVLAALGIFKAPVLALLSRVAPRRPPLQQFCAMAEAALSGGGSAAAAADPAAAPAR